MVVSLTRIASRVKERGGGHTKTPRFNIPFLSRPRILVQIRYLGPSTNRKLLVKTKLFGTARTRFRWVFRHVQGNNGEIVKASAFAIVECVRSGWNDVGSFTQDG